MNILKKTLKEMNSTFTSNEFSKIARGYGLTYNQIRSGAIAKFLHRNAIQTESKRTWHKIIDSKINDVETNNDTVEITNLPIDNIIKILKVKGYKVLKSETKWVEL